MKEKTNIKYAQEEQSLWQELEDKEQEQVIGGTYIGSANHQSIIMAYVGGVQSYLGGVSTLQHFVGGVQAYVGGATFPQFPTL
jgi:hypothetical protein